MRIKLTAPLVFTEKDVAKIVRAITVDTCPHRIALFPRVLREWGEIDVMNAAALGASPVSARERVGRYKKLARSAKKLQDAVEDVVKADNLEWIAYFMVPPGSPIASDHLSQIAQHLAFLQQLQKAADLAQAKLKRRPGQPRNKAAYLVLLDLAAIFKWLTGLKPEREVSRIDSRETGAFYCFCEAVWPLVFDCGFGGLPAAMKNWARDHQKYNESSALIANLQLRHPSWGVLRR